VCPLACICDRTTVPLRLRTERPFQVEAVVTGSTFSAWRKAFVEEHCDKFSFDDENKLEYTQIHEKYEVGVEDILRKEMLKGFAMEDFMAALPAYLEGPGAQKEETSKAVRPVAWKTHCFAATWARLSACAAQ
jgi:hypothetical protein